ncbi:ABC transporter permease, partial [Streptomyces lydicus]
MSGPWTRRARRAAAVLGALALWQVLAQFHVDLWLRFAQFPTVTETAGAFARRLGTATYWQDVTESLTRIVTGFALAAVLGVAVGTAVARSHLVSDQI